MDAVVIAGMWQRLATPVGWLHATPLDPSEMDHLTQGPKASLGDTPFGADRGAFGEHYTETPARAYLTSKWSAAILAQFGMVEAGNMELCLVTPFQADLANDIPLPPPELEKAWNEGRFFQARETEGETAAADRFRFLRFLWSVKGPAVPLIQGGVIFGWRVLVSKVTI